jgi:hypothetical protein
MHLNYHVIEVIAKARQEQLLEYAQRSRLSKAIKSKRITFRQRMLLRFGELLILWGSWLKNRYQPRLYTNSVALQADSTNTCISS